VKVTINEIARRANVSKATVSRVINNKADGVSEETRQRVLDIIKKAGYVPNALARGLTTKETKVLGLVLPDITNPFFTKVARGVEDLASKYGYSTILCDTDDDFEKESSYIDILIKNQVDGIIYTGIDKNNVKNIKTIVNNNVPCVILDRRGKDIDLPCVFTDSKKGMYNNIKYLLSLGHRNIAYISGPKYSSNSKERLEGYFQALAENGIKPNEKLIVYGDYKLDGGARCMEALLNKMDSFTAVACANDLMAIGALNFLKGKKIKVPEDISITGFDNIDMTNITNPPITTVDQFTYELGCRAGELLIKILKREEVKEKIIVLEPELRIKESVKRGISCEDSGCREHKC